MLKTDNTSWLNRTSIQIPAVTKVELWTNALTGVGAAIAAGSQLTKGHWALLVMAKNKVKTNNNPLALKETRIEPLTNQIQKLLSKRASPTRLVIRVTSPPFILIQL
jgi:hypothetical protein